MAIRLERAMATTVTELWQHVSNGLRTFIAKRVADEAEVDDVLQEVFLRMHRGIENLRAPRSVVSWAYQITRHAIIDHRRKFTRRRELTVGLTADLETVAASSAEPAIGHSGESGESGELHAELAGCLRPMIDQLATEYRGALILVEFSGLTQKAAAKQLGLSLSGMKSRVQRGRRQLKRMLDECCLIRLDRRGGVVGYTARGRKGSACRPSLRDRDDAGRVF